MLSSFIKKDDKILKRVEREQTGGRNVMDKRVEKIKEYLDRISRGEDFDCIRTEFVRDFQDVDSNEIMRAEQKILAEGTPVEELQKLCDVHSALFHERTTKMDSMEKLTEVVGHPLYTLTRENDALEELLSKAKAEIQKGKVEDSLISELRSVAIHYAKKGDLLYPVLKVRYHIEGPASVMWSVDNDIREELRDLGKEKNKNQLWFERLDAVVTRMEEMIYKERNILFPTCASNFSAEEWMGIYHDAKDYEDCLGVESMIWPEAEKVDTKKAVIEKNSEEVMMVGGHMTVEQIQALLNTIPLEITFVDGEDINRFFNEGPKVFKRPAMAIGREVFSCHPPKVEKKVRTIIEEFKKGTLDEVPIWMEKSGKIFLVRYMAVRDGEGKYIGAAEFVQDMEFAREYFIGKAKNYGED